MTRKTSITVAVGALVGALAIGASVAGAKPEQWPGICGTPPSN